MCFLEEKEASFKKLGKKTPFQNQKFYSAVPVLVLNVKKR